MTRGPTRLTHPPADATLSRVQRDVVTLAELAKLLSRAPDSLRQRVHRGTLPARKIGNQWVVSRSTADAEVRRQAKVDPSA